MKITTTLAHAPTQARKSEEKERDAAQGTVRTHSFTHSVSHSATRPSYPFGQSFSDPTELARCLWPSSGVRACVRTARRSFLPGSVD